MLNFVVFVYFMLHFLTPKNCFLVVFSNMLCYYCITCTSCTRITCICCICCYRRCCCFNSNFSHCYCPPTKLLVLPIHFCLSVYCWHNVLCFWSSPSAGYSSACCCYCCYNVYPIIVSIFTKFLSCCWLPTLTYSCTI